MNINQFLKDNYAEYIDDISNWVDGQYNYHFRSCFEEVKKIQDSMKSQVRPITDSELEWVLTELPMKMFSISESLNKVRLEAEVIKLRKKTVKSQFDADAAAMVKAGDLPKTEAKAWVDTELADHDILLAAYNSLITRVESEISLSKELIMGCKKIWDARKRTEQSNPVGEVVPSNLPNYNKNYSYSDRYSEPYM